jgi:hypothetical protein
MVKKLALIVAPACVLAAPAAAPAAGGHGIRAATKAACRAENPGATRREIRRCARQDIRAASHACRAERAAGRQAFRAEYGKRPMRACVREHVTSS